MIEAGKLTDKVNILRRVLSKDKWGSEAIKYIKELTTRANVLVENGQMTERANEIYYTYNISVLARKLRVAEYDIVEWRGDYYQVQSIVPTRERDGQYIKAIKIDSTLVIPALVRRYNVKFYTYREGVDYLYAETQTNDDGTFVFPTPPSQVDYLFAGWYTLPDAQGTLVEDGFVATADIKLYAYMEEAVVDEAEYILSHMPPAIRSALVAWFSPYYQHLTNVEFAQHPYLVDLCGSSLTLRTRNFAFTPTSGINDSGIVFDGINDSMYTSSNISSQTAGISLFVQANAVQRQRFIIEQRQNQTAGTGAWTYLLELPNTSGANNRNSSEAFYVEGQIGVSFDAMTFFDSKEAFRMHMLNNAPITYINNLFVGSSNGANYASMTLYGLIIWNRLLTANEVAWVERSMMKDHREEAQADE